MLNKTLYLLDTNHIKKLPNSPLQEVVFEVFLEEEIDSKGVPKVEKYQFAQGLFFHKIKDEFPVHVTKKHNPSIKIYPSIRHQFWKNHNTWPVVQFGPGLMTLNDTEINYEWNKFLPLIKKCLDTLYSSYDNAIKVNRLSLKYIDAIEFKTKDVSQQLDFINRNFQMNLKNNFELKGSKQEAINIHQTFNLDSLGHVSFIISSGFSKNNLPSLIWQTQITIDNSKNEIDILDWVDKGHSVISDLFKQTITEDFYDSFK